MALNPISARLRVVNKSNGVAKVSLVVAAGDELEVSSEVAAQLPSAFAAVAEPELALEPVAKAEPEAPAKKSKKNADD